MLVFKKIIEVVTNAELTCSHMKPVHQNMEALSSYKAALTVFIHRDCIFNVQPCYPVELCEM